jgi:hypothetical protein
MRKRGIGIALVLAIVPLSAACYAAYPDYYAAYPGVSIGGYWGPGYYYPGYRAYHAHYYARPYVHGYYGRGYVGRPYAGGYGYHGWHR